MSLGQAGEQPGLRGGLGEGPGLCWTPGCGTTGSFHPREELPYSRAGLLVEQSNVYIKVTVRLVLTFMWNREDSALVRMSPPHAPPGLSGRASQTPGAGAAGAVGSARLAEAGAAPPLPPAGAGPQVREPDLRSVRGLQRAPGCQRVLLPQ